MQIKKFWFKIYHWKTWHYLAKYIPLFPAWVWYCSRSGSLWFFTPSNPTITFGGFEGERKKEMYDQLPQEFYPKSIYISPDISLKDLEKVVVENGYAYPFAVKPDAGMMGFMFRKIENKEQLFQYHTVMPVDYIVQQLVKFPLEVSVFYYRLPNENQGTITGFLKKEFLEVIGDGKSALLELIMNYERVQFRIDEMKAKHSHRLNDIIPAGEIYILSYALNLSRGGKLVSLEKEKDERLLKVFDDLSHYTGFYYGRYDIKCASVGDLKEGKNFSILEYNGCGAEPHHIYGNGNNIFQAYKIVLDHWKMLYRISRYNYNNGVKYWSYKKGIHFLKEAKKHFKILRKLDSETLV
ncbi:MAG: hypothetical protein ABIY51_10890 [Ferruginibacter sp.]